MGRQQKRFADKLRVIRMFLRLKKASAVPGSAS
jgi:hypothetical protein